MSANKGSVLLKLLVVLVVLAGAGAAAYFASRDTAIVSEVKLGLAVDGVPGSLVVHADKGLQEIKGEVGGRVVAIEAGEGELDRGKTFKKGDALVQLDTTELKRQLDEAKRALDEAKEKAKIANLRDAKLADAQRALENVKRFADRGEVSKEDLTKAERAVAEVETALDLNNFALKKAESDFESAKKALELQLDKMTIKAPADGMFEAVMVAPGALIGPGSTVATYYRVGRDVIAKVSEEDVAKVKIGDPAQVRLITYPNIEFEASVVKILPFADAETRRYEVYLKVKAELEQLRPNSTGEATIRTGQHDNVPLVERRAIFNGKFVYVVANGQVEKREIGLGFKGLNIAEVTKNLKAGELVIVENLDQFRHGQRVRVAPLTAK